MLHRLADDARIGAEVAPPELLADHRDVAAARLVLVRQ